MENLMSTKDVATFLNVNEKMVYTLVAEKNLPATKITGKWLFPKHLVEQWIEANTTNFPEAVQKLPPYHGLLIIAGSNDLLLDKAISLFNATNSEEIVVFGNLGSMGGLSALRKNLCHIASSHLLQENGSDYNFSFAARELDALPAVVNFCRREQGIILQKGNPKNIRTVTDLAKSGITIVNRSLATGTRLLLDNELRAAGIKGEKISGYQNIANRHMDVGLEILAGKADAGPGIRPVAALLGLDFIPLRWERFDLLVSKDIFFEPGVQKFQGLLHEKAFKNLAKSLDGYDIGDSGKIVFPQ
ncbi:MAG: helix-turn-helix transcriptional regulator [Thermodesulfobacteriota bacterium]